MIWASKQSQDASNLCTSQNFEKLKFSVYPLQSLATNNARKLENNLGHNKKQKRLMSVDMQFLVLDSVF